MQFTFLFISILLFSCSSIKYGTIAPTDKPIEKWKKSPNQQKIDQIFNLAAGLQTYPYVIINDLGNGMSLYYYGFDYKAEEESYKLIRKSIKSKFGFNGDFINGPTIDLPEPSKTYTLSTTNGDENLNISIAIVPHKDNGLVGILIVDAAKNGQQTHNEIMTNVAYHGIPSQIVQPYTNTTIKIGNQYRRVDNCNWMDIQNISCYPDGQMNWSLNSTLSGAIDRLETQLNHILLNDDLVVMQDDSIDIMFLNKPAKMRRIIQTVDNLVFKLFVPGSSVLYSYYVATEIDSSKYINWVGSHYEDQATSTGLSSLLEEVVSYKNKPKSRIISDVNFPSLDTLKSFLENNITEPVNFSQKIISNEETQIEISTKYSDTLRFSLFRKEAEIPTISIVQTFLNNIGKKDSESANIVRKKLKETNTVVQFPYLEYSNKLKDLLYSFCRKKIAGMYQVDYRGFYIDRDLAFRMK
jgi:hypothetical protein